MVCDNRDNVLFRGGYSGYRPFETCLGLYRKGSSLSPLVSPPCRHLHSWWLHRQRPNSWPIIRSKLASNVYSKIFVQLPNLKTSMVAAPIHSGAATMC